MYWDRNVNNPGLVPPFPLIRCEVLGDGPPALDEYGCLTTIRLMEEVPPYRLGQVLNVPGNTVYDITTAVTKGYRGR